MRPPTQLYTSLLLLLGGLLLLIAACYGLESAGVAAQGDPLPLVTAALLAAIPAALWMGFFYLQDYRAPEPPRLVAGVFLLGAFIAGPVARVLTDDLLHLPAFFDSPRALDTPRAWILLVAGAGMAQEFSKYLVVRYSIYPAADFDEPVDGVVYATAAGLGLAAYQSIHYLTHLGGVTLTIGVVHVVILTLAHACFAGVTGAFLGRAKFGIGGQGSLALGLSLAALLNGAFSIVRDQLTTGGFAVSHATSLLLSAGLALAVFSALFVWMRRAVRASRGAHV